jgi:ATP-dependent protease ClpP protease subunit
VPKATTIKLYDEIGGWGIWFSDFERQLAQASGDVELLIHSPGGDAFDGMAMANAVKAYDRGKVTGIVMGLCASAAGFVLAACDVRKMYAASQFMCHEASVMAWGKEADLLDAARRLVDINRQQAEMFAGITGKSVDDVLALLKAETWYTAKAAKTEGFIHEVLDATAPGIDQKATAQWMARFRNVPEEWTARVEPFRAAASANPFAQKRTSSSASAPVVPRATHTRTTMRTKKDLIGIMTAALSLAMATAQEAANHDDSELRDLSGKLLDDECLPQAMNLVMPIAQAEKADEEADAMAKGLVGTYRAAQKVTGQSKGLVGALEALRKNADGVVNATMATRCDMLIAEGVKALKILPTEGEAYKAAVLKGDRTVEDFESFVKAAIPRGKGSSAEISESPVAKKEPGAKQPEASDDGDDEYMQAAQGVKVLKGGA